MNSSRNQYPCPHRVNPELNVGLLRSEECFSQFTDLDSYLHFGITLTSVCFIFHAVQWMLSHRRLLCLLGILAAIYGFSFSTQSISSFTRSFPSSHIYSFTHLSTFYSINCSCVSPWSWARSCLLSDLVTPLQSHNVLEDIRHGYKGRIM